MNVIRKAEQDDDVIRNLVAWADRHAEVRAMLLTSTRAVPDATLDAWSDYDVILVVADIHPFDIDRSWLNEFGEVLVAYWDPIGPHSVTGIPQVSNVTQYASGLKIDFTLWSIEQMRRIATAPTLNPGLDAGYRVLLDKDRLTADLREPTYAAYIPKRPDEATYQTLVNDFFTGVPYVAKCLLRDELLPAKWCLDYDMRDVYLRPMLEWRMECDHGWSVPAGALGKGLKRRLPPEIWAELEATYAAAGIDDNWDSLFRTIAFFRRIAREVGAHLGYAYPENFDRRVTDHALRMRSGEPLGRPNTDGPIL
jgi:aminoglycoside 6-adenylyltransferase